MRLRPHILAAALLATAPLPCLAEEPTPAADAAAPAAQAPAAQQLPEATPHAYSAVAAPDRARLGEPLALEVEVRDDPAVRYELPSTPSLGKDVDVRKVEVSREDLDGETVTRIRLELALFALGDLTLPDLALQATGPDGRRRLLVPGPKVVGVADTKEDAELEETMPPVDVLVKSYRLLWILGAALAVALLALLLFRPLSRWLRRERTAPAAPPLPAHARALQALESLRREDLPNQGRGQEFHFRLSEIVRGYLGERFGVLALDMTSDELLAALTRVRAPGLDCRRFEEFCREGDLVKYARAPAAPSACQAALEAAFGFVESTVPPPPAAGGDAPKGAAA